MSGPSAHTRAAHPNHHRARMTTLLLSAAGSGSRTHLGTLIQTLDQRREPLHDDSTPNLEGRGELPGFLGQLAIEQSEVLDLLEARAIRVDGVDHRLVEGRHFGMLQQIVDRARAPAPGL